jgi:hypothetical protein
VKSPAGERSSDRIALGVLSRAFPPELIDTVVAECGRVEQRRRLSPARVVVSFLLVHHALRDLMHQAAHHAGRDSFTRTLRIVRRHVAGWTVVGGYAAPDRSARVWL